MTTRTRPLICSSPIHTTRCAIRAGFYFATTRLFLTNCFWQICFRRSVEVRLAVQNLLDTTPPIVPDPNNMGYDYRSDPRRRRFELSLVGHF